MASGKRKKPQENPENKLEIRFSDNDFEDSEPEVVDVREEDVELEPEGDEIEVEVEVDDIITQSESVLSDVEVQEAEQFLETVTSQDTGLVQYDPLKAYIQQVRNYPLLAADEEIKLSIEYQKHRNPEASRRLITSNLRLVVKIAHEYSKASNNLLDLIQEGNIGLIQAVDKFDPYRGVKLSTYSSWWIRAYILKYLLNNWRLVKIGTTQAQRKLFFNLHKQQELLKAKGISPTSQALAEALDVSEKEVNEMQKRMAASDLSLATPVRSSDGDERSIMEFMPADQSPPDEIVAADEIHRILNEKIKEFAAELSGRDLVIMRDRLLAEDPMTLKDIGDRYGISRERARQLERRLIKKLRTYLEEELGENVDIALGFES